MLSARHLDDLVCKHLRIEVPPADMSAWRFCGPDHFAENKVNLAVVGKYIEHQDA